MTVSSEDRKQRDIDVIDFLRGLAAFGVVLFHNRIHLYVGVQELYGNPSSYSGFDRVVAALALPTSCFGTFVMLFFVISGFCIHLPYAGGGRRLKLRHHLVRRFVRIYIPYASAIVVTLLCERFALALNGADPSSSGKVIQSFFMVQNYGSPPGQMIGNASLWSLPIEMELYLVFPLIYFVLLRFGMRTAVAVVSLATLAGVVGDSLGLWWAQGSFVRYWLVWWLGAVLAEVYRRPGGLPKLPWPAVVTTLVMGASMAAGAVLDWPKRYLDLVSGTFFFFIVWFALRASPLVGRLPTTFRKTLKSVGLSSYSLYLIHFPFFAAFGAVHAAHFSGKSSNYLVPLTLSFAVLPAAYLFYLAIEKPSHTLARRLAAPFA